MKKIVLCIMLLPLILSACIYDTENLTGNNEDDNPIIPPTEDATHWALPSAETNSEYVLLARTFKWDTKEYEYVFLNKGVPNLAEGKEHFDVFLDRYEKDSNSQVKSITTDSKYIVFEEYPNDNDSTIEVYEGENLIFSNTVSKEAYILSEKDYGFDPNDYVASLTSILRSGYGFYSYPAANAMIDILSTTGNLPIGISSDCTMYIMVEWDYNLKDGKNLIYSYPDYELIVTFELPYCENGIFTDGVLLNQIVDEQHIIYTIWDTATTYLLDLSNNTAVVIGHDLWNPILSPDKSHFAYAIQSWNSTLGGFYILDMETQETCFFEAEGLGKNDILSIVGWVEKSDIMGIKK